MNKYQLYEKVMKATPDTFVAAARNWVEGADYAPFVNEEAKMLFSDAKRYCAAWRNKAIDGRISKSRMVNAVQKIVDMNLPNPYDPKEPDPAEIVAMPVTEPVAGTVEVPAEEKVSEEKSAKEIIEEPAKETTHVLGVVPEEKEEKGFFSRRKKR